MMRLFLLIIVAMPSSVASAQVHSETTHSHPVAAVQAAHMYAPSAIPDRIILTLNQDPRTTQTVNWRTSVEVVTGLVEIAEAEGGPLFTEKAQQFKAGSKALKTDLSTAHYHHYTFKELKPGTTYAYRVGDGTNWSEWFHFRTAAAEDEPFSFVYFGDAQNNLRSMWSRVVREAYREAPKAAFLLHAGDLVNSAQADAEWGEWFGAGAWLNAMTPSIAVPGNHEHLNVEGVGRKLTHHWQNVFTFPENGPPGLEETCYTLTYHNVRIVAMNSLTMHKEQAKWMDEVLSKNTSRWVVCTFHHPIFSTGKDRDNASLRAIWKPILDKHKVDLVLQGHDHCYGRTGFDVPAADAKRDEFTNATASDAEPVGYTNVATGLQKFEEQHGTVYVVSVSGPKMYNNTRFNFMKRIAEDTQLYQIIHVDGDKLTFEARTALGKLYDSFELHKQNGTINKLVEIEPEVPQNLRPLPKEAPASK